MVVHDRSSPGKPAELIQGSAICARLLDLLGQHSCNTKARSAKSTILQKSAATLGIALNGTKIHMLCVGGPAYNCQRLAEGDVIIGIDGVTVDDSNVIAFLVGSDIPDSTVTITVMKATTQHAEEIELARMSTAEIAGRQRLLELFNDMKEVAMDEDDHFQIERVEEAMELWTQMMIHEAEHQKHFADGISQLHQEIREGICELASLMVSNTEGTESSNKLLEKLEKEVADARTAAVDVLHSSESCVSTASAAAVAVEQSMIECHQLVRTLTACCTHVNEFTLSQGIYAACSDLQTKASQVKKMQEQIIDLTQQLQESREKNAADEILHEDELQIAKTTVQCAKDEIDCKQLSFELSLKEAAAELAAEKTRTRALLEQGRMDTAEMQKKHEEFQRRIDMYHADAVACKKALEEEVQKGAAFNVCVAGLEVSLAGTRDAFATHQIAARNEMTRVQRELQKEIDVARMELYRAQEKATRDVLAAKGMADMEIAEIQRTAEKEVATAKEAARESAQQLKIIEEKLDNWSEKSKKAAADAVEEAIKKVREEKEEKKRDEYNRASLLSDARVQIRTLEDELKTLAAESNARLKCAHEKLKNAERSCKETLEKMARLDKLASAYRNERDGLEGRAKASIARLRALLSTFVVETRTQLGNLAGDLDASHQNVQRLTDLQLQENEEIISLKSQLALKEFECHEMTLCAAVMDTTKHQLEERQEQAMRNYLILQRRVLRKCVIEFRGGSSLWNSFPPWKRYFRRCARLRQAGSTISSRNYYRRANIAMCEWLAWTREFRNLRSRTLTVVCRMIKRGLLQALESWKDRVERGKRREGIACNVLKNLVQAKLPRPLALWRVLCREGRRHRITIHRVVLKMVYSRVSTVLRRWKGNVVESRVRRQRMCKLEALWSGSVRAAMLGKWHERTDTAKKQRHKVAKSLQKFLHQCMVMGFEHWKVNVDEAMMLRAKLRKVCVHWVNQTSVHILNVWQEFAAKEVRQQISISRVLARIQHGKLYKSLHTWAENTAEAVAHKLIVQKILTRMLRKGLVVAFGRWVVRAAEQQGMRTKTLRVAQRWIHVTLEQFWKTWRCNTQKIRNVRETSHKVVARWKQKRAARFMEVLRALTVNKNTYRTVVAKVVLRLKKSTLSNALAWWQGCARKTGRAREVMRKILVHMRRRTLALALHTWAEGVDEALTEQAETERRSRIMKKLAVRLRNNSLATVFGIWSDTVEICIAEDVEQARREILLQRVVRHMKDAVLARAFARWHDASIELLAEAKSAAAAADAAAAAATAEAEQQQHCACMVRRYLLKMMYKWMAIALAMWKFATDVRFFLRNNEAKVEMRTKRATIVQWFDEWVATFWQQRCTSVALDRFAIAWIVRRKRSVLSGWQHATREEQQHKSWAVDKKALETSIMDVHADLMSFYKEFHGALSSTRSSAKGLLVREKRLAKQNIADLEEDLHLAHCRIAQLESQNEDALQILKQMVVEAADKEKEMETLRAEREESLLISQPSSVSSPSISNRKISFF